MSSSTTHCIGSLARPTFHLSLPSHDRRVAPSGLANGGCGEQRLQDMARTTVAMEALGWMSIWRISASPSRRSRSIRYSWPAPGDDMARGSDGAGGGSRERAEAEKGGVQNSEIDARSHRWAPSRKNSQKSENFFCIGRKFDNNKSSSPTNWAHQGLNLRPAD